MLIIYLFLIIVSLITVVGSVFKIITGYKKQQERKSMIERFEKKYPPSKK